MAVEIINKPNTDPVSGTYPYGRIRDNAGLNNGTPVNELVYGDFHQFFAKLIYTAGASVNGLRENAVNGFQYYDALKTSTKKYLGTIPLSATTNLTSYLSLFGAAVYQILFEITGSSADTQQTLPPSASLEDGASFTFKNSDLFNVEVLPDGSDTISGLGTVTMYGKGDFITLILDKGNTNWNVLTKGLNNDKIVPLVTNGNVTISRVNYPVMYWASSLVAGNLTWTLASGATFSDGDIVMFKNLSNNYDISITPFAGDSIDMVLAPIVLTSQGDYLELVWTVAQGWMIKSKFIAEITVPWIYIGSGGGAPAFGSGYSNTAAQPAQAGLRYRKIGVEYVEVTGIIDGPALISPGFPIFTLPSGARPLFTISNCQKEITTDADGKLIIYNTGAFEYNGGSASSGSSRFFINIRIPLN